MILGVKRLPHIKTLVRRCRLLPFQLKVKGHALIYTIAHRVRLSLIEDIMLFMCPRPPLRSSVPC